MEYSSSKSNLANLGDAASSNSSDDNCLDVMSIIMYKRSNAAVPMAASSSSGSQQGVPKTETVPVLPTEGDASPVSSSSTFGGRGRGRSVDSDDKLKEVCRICSDIATGFHYGVVSCEGCKGFFKRSVQMNRKYRCRLLSQCAVNRKTRNSCQSCRFTKCLTVGMSVSLVRPDRTPGNRRKRPLSKKELSALNNASSEENQLDAGQSCGGVLPLDLPDPNQNGSSAARQDQDTSASPASDLRNDLSPSNSSDSGNTQPSLGMVSGANGNQFSVCEEKTDDSWTEPQLNDIFTNVEPMRSNPPTTPNNATNINGNHRAFEQRLTLGVPPIIQGNAPVADDIVFSVMSTNARQIIQIVKAAQPNIIPDATSHLQPVLTSQSFMNTAYSELETIVCYSKMQLGFNALFMNDRRQLLRNSFLAMQLVRLSFRSVPCDGNILFAKGLCLNPNEAVQVSKFPPIVIDMNLELIDWFRNLLINEVECGLIQTIILSSDDADGLTDRVAIRRMQNTYVETLREYSICRFPHAPHRFASLLLRLPFIRKMSLVCLENFFLMIESGQLTMDQLTGELVSI